MRRWVMKGGAKMEGGREKKIDGQSRANGESRVQGEFRRIGGSYEVLLGDVTWSGYLSR